MRVLQLVSLVAALVTIPVSAHADLVADGEKIFKRCKACHAVGEGAKNKVGPQLNGIVGASAAGVEGYKYSKALKESGLTWDDANLTAFLKKPKALVKGTKMSFPGIKKDEQVAAVIAYLNSYSADGTRR